MHRKFFVLAAVAAFLAVALGAFGAHGLRSRLTESEMQVFRTAVDYHMWHALGLGWVALLLERSPDSRALAWAGGLLAAGILLFSGSLYLLALTGIRALGWITPFGGLAFLAAWLLAAIGAARQR